LSSSHSGFLGFLIFGFKSIINNSLSFGEWCWWGSGGLSGTIIRWWCWSSFCWGSLSWGSLSWGSWSSSSGGWLFSDFDGRGGSE
jgi:hypothetical protein